MGWGEKRVWWGREYSWVGERRYVVGGGEGRRELGGGEKRVRWGRRGEKRVGWREGRRELGGRGKRGEDSGERGEITVGGERL